mmetsp:Transcript_17907/g.22061  ORF Transcript_17907/g.22061 Transcript_17907/m.22061 type:complete len:370 (+) Transcript_17907:24-1133(+)|eukprot:CAMPEP_0204860792 /NCGR_PEP_ID=MMETSP1348-20121228/874_1 /ASSEMBLY_ACC=CAM_ASM_000700 /TAXON_ID=215587 /ORGANISM="Aplanochytrium stocchinoi, Strain GSBS06" /LENGTH=369 /DNA_ID=CAMNT_0052009757 /DNA_START=16 /DNA_END=1125 /DNA_ORIENTATION=-
MPNFKEGSVYRGDVDRFVPVEVRVKRFSFTGFVPSSSLNNSIYEGELNYQSHDLTKQVPRTRARSVNRELQWKVKQLDFNYKNDAANVDAIGMLRKLGSHKIRHNNDILGGGKRWFSINLGSEKKRGRRDSERRSKIREASSSRKSPLKHPLWKKLIARGKKGSSILNRGQFGVPVDSDTMPRVYLSRYAAPIPAVLVALKQQLLINNGLRLEGVFRVSASKVKKDMYKDQLDHGNFEGCKIEDVMCMASLIKEWFRCLPTPLLNVLDANSINEVSTSTKPEGAVIPELLFRIPEPNHSIFLWLLDLLTMVCYYGKLNRMNPKNVAIVIAPNLYAVPEGLPPMQTIAAIENIVAVLRKSIRYRMLQLTA